MLAMYAAASEQNVPKEKMLALLQAVMREHETGCVWPKGF